MKAVLCERYGSPDVLRLAEVERPAPGPGQVLIRIHCATVTLGDCELRSFSFPAWIWLPLRLVMGVTRPRRPIFGMEMAGEVAALGAGVSRFAVGDRVFGSTGFILGCHAEYVCMPADGPLTTMPDTLSFAEAAGIPTGGLNGLHFVRKAEVAAGERVLIVGAGGGIGTFAVQLAKRRGAHVTAVDRGDKLALLRDLGADATVDYTTEDVTRLGQTWDVIIDVIGRSPYWRTLAALRPGGRYVNANPRGWQMLLSLVTPRREGRRIMFQMAGLSVADLDELKLLVANGAIRVPIDRRVPLAGVPEAHRYVEAGNKAGVLVVEVPGDP